MVVTLAGSNLGGSSTRPSNPHKYAHLCGKKIDIMESFKGVTTILIFVDIIFLIGMFFFSIPFLVFRGASTLIGYWFLYMVAFKDSNPKIMIFFIFNQFIDSIYAIFVFILILFVEVNFNGYSEANGIFVSIEIFIIISNFITVCFKTCFMGYYTRFYKFILWNQENINNIIATYTNSTTFGNNIYPNPPPNILVIPGSDGILHGPQNMPPLPKYNDVITEPLSQKVVPLDVVENITTTRSEEVQTETLPTTTTNESFSNLLIDPTDLISTPDFRQIPLNDSSIFDTIIQVPKNKEENNDIIQNQSINENGPPPSYHISNTEFKPNDKKENDSDKFDNPFQ
ncbi:Hypothetical protein SRAE_2000072600 [Strongyloides ratti]|uniref:Uncharacterized protein n=1 Tax=Strongyloides ratti TaxID=34506 RepID=A0A090L8E3_STRRB|nr:Hypothetical protein SRAE_2000072600 [Strongyloides ratti]CEF66056.1 Hypothetical protein SRAE_2000072600 [Strongyloides ratti]